MQGPHLESRELEERTLGHPPSRHSLASAVVSGMFGALLGAGLWCLPRPGAPTVQACVSPFLFWLMALQRGPDPTCREAGLTQSPQGHRRLGPLQDHDNRAPRATRVCV